ncbi:MAG: hypothetical protein KME11_21575 [Timaviella obliquedivisa GSE-PSE-MK23-08B]|nr:hypothetical protein [Timaviella obliquedivisa GSE-PSE-MK23-08B]
MERLSSQGKDIDVTFTQEAVLEREVVGLTVGFGRCVLDVQPDMTE